MSVEGLILLHVESSGHNKRVTTMDSSDLDHLDAVIITADTLATLADAEVATVAVDLARSARALLDALLARAMRDENDGNGDHLAFA